MATGVTPYLSTDFRGRLLCRRSTPPWRPESLDTWPWLYFQFVNGGRGMAGPILSGIVSIAWFNVKAWETAF